MEAVHNNHFQYIFFSELTKIIVFNGFMTLVSTKLKGPFQFFMNLCLFHRLFCFNLDWGLVHATLYWSYMPKETLFSPTPILQS